MTKNGALPLPVEIVGGVGAVSAPVDPMVKRLMSLDPELATARSELEGSMAMPTGELPTGLPPAVMGVEPGTPEERVKP